MIETMLPVFKMCVANVRVLLLAKIRKLLLPRLTMHRTLLSEVYRPMVPTPLRRDSLMTALVVTPILAWLGTPQTMTGNPDRLVIVAKRVTTLCRPGPPHGGIMISVQLTFLTLVILPAKVTALVAPPSLALVTIGMWLLTTPVNL